MAVERIPELPADLLVEAQQALRLAGPGATVSHELAATAWGVEMVEDPVKRLTVPRNRSRRSISGWDVRRSDIPTGDVELVEDVRVTAVLRTLVDLSRVLCVAHAVVAVDSALRAGLVRVEELALRRAIGRGARRLRTVGGLVDPLAGSVLESLLRVLLAEAGLPAPLTQYVVLDRAGEFVGRVDFCWPAARLIVEADGFAFHSDRAAYREDRRRLNELERLGWRVLRFSWEDVVCRPEAVVALVRDCLQSAA